MFDTSIFYDEEVVAEKEVSTVDLVPTASEVVTTAGVEAKGIVIQEPSETPAQTPIDSSQPLKAKDKGKAKMIKLEKPLKRKDQIMIDEDVARNLEAQMQAKLEEAERLLAARLQEEEREELTIEEKSRLFVELMDKRKKYFARLRAEKIKKLVKGSEKVAEGSSKRAADKLE
nr:hypothetical protein [Tanacetum cinerariifolium]